MEVIKQVRKLFQPRRRSILGLDISSTAVKIMEISRSDEQFCVQGYGREPLPAGASIHDIDAVTHCIKNLIQREHFTSKQVALAVPDSAVITKTIQLDNGLNNEEMEELIASEVDKSIPYPIDEIHVDFEILGPCVKNAVQLDVLVVASRAEHVNARVEAVARAGLQAVVVDVESYAVERAAHYLFAELPGKISAIIDISTHHTHLYVFHDMKLIFTRDEPYGAIHLIKAIADQYNLSIEYAQVALHENSLPDNYQTTVLEPFNQTMLLHIKRSLQFFYSTNQPGVVEHIVFAGDLAWRIGLDTWMQEQLNLDTSIANPVLQLSLTELHNTDAIYQDAPTLLVTCGLALRHIDD